MTALRHALYFGLAVSFGMQSVAGAAGEVPTTRAANCEYMPTSLLAPQVGNAGPLVRYDPAARVVTVLLQLARRANLNDYFPYYLATSGREPVRMTVEGPLAQRDAVRYGAAESETVGEYWVLTAPLPSPAPFAVFFDEVWLGTDSRTRRPCSAVLRRLVRAVTAGPQLQNERGPCCVLPFIRLTLPVSTETLASIGVRQPSLQRTLILSPETLTVVRFRSDVLRPHRETELAAQLDTRRGFDVSIASRAIAPANAEYRYVIGRSDNGEFVLQRFAWSLGEAVAVNDTLQVHGSAQPDGSSLLRLDAGYGWSVTLKIKTTADGLIQIVDVSG